MTGKIKRPKITEGITIRIRTGCGNLYVTLGYIQETKQLIEVFATLGKSGGCPKAQTEAITRSISLGLKYNIPISEYIEEFSGISCPNYKLDEGVEVKSCADAIAQVLKEFVDGNKKQKGE